jgi:uncharacterized membrane protein
MFTTVLLLIICALIAALSVPLILKLIPPNPIYGFRTQRTLDKAETWFAVNQFGGRALLASSAVTILALMFYSGTWLKSPWSQWVAFLIPLAAAIAVTLWYERRIS